MKIKKYFDRKFLKLYLIDLIYFILTFGFIFFALFKINQYVTILKTINPEQALTQSYDIDIQALTNYLNIASPLTNKILLLFFLIPAVAFILYILLQGLSWSKIKEIKYKYYLWRFLIVTLVFSVIFYLLFYIISLFKVEILLDIILLIFIYILFVAYSLIKKNLLKDLKKSFILSFKRLHPLFLIYILWIISSLIVLFFYTLAKGFLNIPISIITLLILIALFTLFKRILYNFTSKYN